MSTAHLSTPCGSAQRPPNSRDAACSSLPSVADSTCMTVALSKPSSISRWIFASMAAAAAPPPPVGAAAVLPPPARTAAAAPAADIPPPPAAGALAAAAGGGAAAAAPLLPAAPPAAPPALLSLVAEAMFSSACCLVTYRHKHTHHSVQTHRGLFRAGAEAWGGDSGGQVHEAAGMTCQDPRIVLVSRVNVCLHSCTLHATHKSMSAAPQPPEWVSLPQSHGG